MARNTQLYNVTVGTEVQQVATLREVKELLGDKTITTKAIMAGEYADVVTLSELEEQSTVDVDFKDEFAIQEQAQHEKEYLAELKEETAPKTQLVEPTEDAIKAIQDAHEEHIALTNTQEEDTTLTNTDRDVEHSDTDKNTTPDSGIEFPEVGHFKDEKAMKKYVKGLSDDELAEWCELEGAEYASNSHQAINRMRMAMAIKGIHFPDTVAKKGSSKKKSKYSDYSTEDLVQMAIDNDVEVRDDKGDMRILRMYTIMALKEAGLIG
jgi:hypothetical protein